MKTVTILVLQLFIILASCGFLINSSFLAKEVQGLFEISVPVDNQGNSERKLATRKALIEIMVRISGQSAAASNAILDKNLTKSTAYIQRYLYREADTIDANGNNIKQIMLDLFFDEMALRNLLRDTGLPRWGSNRPQLLIWLAIGDQNRRYMMGTDEESMLQAMIQNVAEDELIDKLKNSQSLKDTNSDSIDGNSIDLKSIIKTQAYNRGLPILIPLMDLEDSISIDVADVWGRFVTPIRQASLRYDSDAILAGQAMKTGNVWLSRWLLLHKGQTLSWEQQSASIEQALISGIDASTDQLAEQYAVHEDSLQRNEVLISVSNIEQIEDYAHLMNYLQNLTSIHDVNVDKVNASTMHLRINLIGKQEAMLQAISLDNQLSIETMPLIDKEVMLSQLPALFFRWNSEAQAQ